MPRLHNDRFPVDCRLLFIESHYGEAFPIGYRDRLSNDAPTLLVSILESTRTRTTLHSLCSVLVVVDVC